MKWGFEALPDWMEPVGVFLARFLLLAAPFYLTLWIGPDLPLLQEANAAAAANLLDVFGVAAEHSGAYVDTSSLLLYVSTDSTGWKSMAVFAALTLAVPRVPWEKRGVGLGLGLLFLSIVNVSRLVSMIYLVETSALSYDFLHTVLWRWMLTGAVLVAWTVWLRWVNPFQNRGSPR